VLVGGDDLDRRIMRSLFKYFGDDPARDLRLPHDFLDLLSNWQSMPELSQPHYADTLRELRHSSKYPETIDALETLVSNNLGFSLFEEIERTKRKLSSAMIAQFKFAHGSIRIDERITRPQFESMIRQEIRQVRDGIQNVLADAGLTPDQIDVVLRTGGTSLVPAFVNMLAQMFGEDKLREMDPMVSVVGGLGIIAHENGGQRGTYRSKYEDRLDEVIGSLSAQGSAAYQPFMVRIGAKCYVDQDTVIRKMPVEISQLPGMMTAYLDRENDAEDFLRFRLKHEAKIYVAYPSSALQVPNWLAPFIRLEGMTVEIDSEWWGVRELQLYSRSFPAGEVVLGGNAAGAAGRLDAMYLVVVERQDV
jgi:hypothetical protein